MIKNKQVSLEDDEDSDDDDKDENEEVEKKGLFKRLKDKTKEKHAKHSKKTPFCKKNRPFSETSLNTPPPP